MDSFFLLGPEARSRFLHSAAHALGCAYICVWSYITHPSNCLICSDGWFRDDHESRRLFDMYRASFCSVESGCVPGLAYKEGVPCIELADPDLMNLASTQTQRQFYQEAGIKKAVFMGYKNGEIELGMSNTSNVNMQMIQQLFNEDLLQYQSQFPADQSRPSSSSSSLRSLSVSSPEYSSLLLTKAAAGEPSTQSMTMQAYARRQNIQFPTPASDDAAIMRAMLTVISSSAASSTSYADQSRAVQPWRAFKPYNAALAPINTRSKQILGGHKMIKMSIALLRTINQLMRSAEGRLQESRPPTTNQLHHMISERKRREKLNESFHALRMLLPPGSKKDKASVLFNTRDYLKTLKDKVYELEERNQMLQLQLLPDDEIKEGGDSNKRVEVQITRAAESTSQAQCITLIITVRVECDMTDLLLRVLECLKERSGVSLLSVNANTFAPPTGVNARLNLSLQVEAGDWDERSFQEAVTRAVDGVVATRPETADR